MCSTCVIELSVKNIFTEYLQYKNELNNLIISNTLNAALIPNTDTTNQVLIFLRKAKLYNLI